MKKPRVSYDDFSKLDLRVGEVKEATVVETSQKLISLMVNLGEEYGTVEILAGMQEFFKAQEFIGKKFVFIANLEPRAMMGRVSNGMLLAADEAGTPLLIPVPAQIPAGTLLR